MEVVIVTDEVIVRVDSEAHTFHQHTFPGLVTQGNIDLYLRERHDDRLFEALGELNGLRGSLPFAVKVLITLREQQTIGAGLIHLDDVVAELERVDKVGGGTAPIRLTNQFLQGELGRVMVTCQHVINAERGSNEILVELSECHHRQDCEQE